MKSSSSIRSSGVFPARYIGRFAPSPTGPLHAGSLVAALASWLDARAQGGAWLVRIEDTDRTRCKAHCADQILQQLAACGLTPDAPPERQSERSTSYQAALENLLQAGLAYPCGCTRLDIAAANTSNSRSRLIPGRTADSPNGLGEPSLEPGDLGHPGLVYPGTCRTGLHGKPARAWRLSLGLSGVKAYSTEKSLHKPKKAAFSASNTAPDQQTPAQAAINLGADSPLQSADSLVIDWQDRRLGPQQQDVVQCVGDFVLKRADGCWAYQLAVVVDDAAQGITHVVRGADLAGNTARQIVLQRALGLPAVRYLHTPLVLDSRGAKLSKHSHAPALATGSVEAVLAALQTAAQVLDLPVDSTVCPSTGSAAVAHWLAAAVPLWGQRWVGPR